MQHVDFDLVIVGGGIYGCCAALSAVGQGLRVALIDKGHLGTGTTANNYRILHGGLRSLQSLDVARFRESILERQWFLDNFPEHTALSRFVMPLDGIGLSKSYVMRLAGWLNDLGGALLQSTLPPSGIIAREHAREFAEPLNLSSRNGAFYWYDGIITDLEGIIDTMKNAAIEGGARLYEICEVTRLDPSKAAVTTTWIADGEQQTCTSTKVIDATGLWHTAWKRALFPASKHFPSVAWNVIIDRDWRASDAIAFKDRSGQFLFARPRDGKLYIGTGHTCAPPELDQRGAAQIAGEQLGGFLSSINHKTKLGITPSDVLGLEAGVVPSAKTDAVEFARRPLVQQDATGNVWHISGVKLTTARRVAADVVDRVSRAL